MNELIKISSNENDEQVVSARELHKGLGLKKRFSVWWEQNSKQLIEHEDFTSVLSGTVVNNGAKRQLQDYALTIDTAKHLAMQSQTEKGRELFSTRMTGAKGTQFAVAYIEHFNKNKKRRTLWNYNLYQ